MALSRNSQGALYMALSMAGFASNDALIKAISHDVSVGQIMLIRGAMTSVLVFLISWRMGALRPLTVMARPTVGMRVFFEIAAGIVFLSALGNIPLANITSILQSLPLAVTLGAALFLKEPVGWRRWLAIVAGFAGVLIIMRPGPEGFTTASLLAVACVFLAAGRDLSTKRVPPEIPSLMLTTVTVVCLTLTGGLLMPWLGGWKPLTLAVVMHLAAASVFSLVGYQFVIAAMRTGEISFIAPFRYTALLVAFTWGYLFFGEKIDLLTGIGIGIVVASGLYTFHREARRNGRLAQEPSPEVMEG
ncbi:DMT family transporter [Gellertiella hungarica]|uniref:Drug/metabolite transporter (DMT)-like permease n=1 Tax=Gellertiella hungarica TaxID=1572859 RepID=A0A7W6J5Z1_9HYPH|nr:DMT family transporter [Gellertiella hungarica]MBB4064563.1 drug/metabolite transporter (DMT)-like permease [Gellertiella hungarica]